MLPSDPSMIDSADKIDLHGDMGLPLTREDSTFTGVLAQVSIGLDLRARGYALRHRYAFDDGQRIRTTRIVGVGECEAGHYLETASGSRYVVLTMEREDEAVGRALGQIGKQLDGEHPHPSWWLRVAEECVD